MVNQPTQTTGVKLILVTGTSGAGLSTALKILEDRGLQVVDNLPTALIDQLVALEVEAAGRQLAIGLDARTSGFALSTIHTLVENLRNKFGDAFKMVFVSAGHSDLLRRFNATRRQHPLITGPQSEMTLEDAIAADIIRMNDIDPLADVHLDTSGSKPADMRRQLLEGLGFDDETLVPVRVVSFSYRHGLPEGADLVFDMRFANNPHWVDGLRDKTGKDGEVAAFLKTDPAMIDVLTSCHQMLTPMLKRMSRDGRPQVVIAFGCTGGKHRSVYAAEQTAHWLQSQSFGVALHHREIG